MKWSILIVLLLIAVPVFAQENIGYFGVADKTPSVTVRKIDDRTIEIRQVVPDSVKTYDMVEVNQDINTLSNEINALNAKVAELEAKRDSLLAVFDKDMYAELVAKPSEELADVKEGPGIPGKDEGVTTDEQIYNP